MISLKYIQVATIDNRHLSAARDNISKSRVKVKFFFLPADILRRQISQHRLTCNSRLREKFALAVTLLGSRMSDAVQESCQSLSATLSTVLIAGLARTRAVYVPSASASRGLQVVSVRQMRVVGTMRVHAPIDVRHIARGEIRCPTATCGVPVITVSKLVSQLFSEGGAEQWGPTYTPGGCWWAARSFSSTSRMPFSTGEPM